MRTVSRCVRPTSPDGHCRSWLPRRCSSRNSVMWVTSGTADATWGQPPDPTRLKLRFNTRRDVSVLNPWALSGVSTMRLPLRSRRVSPVMWKTRCGTAASRLLVIARWRKPVKRLKKSLGSLNSPIPSMTNEPMWLKFALSAGKSPTTRLDRSNVYPMNWPSGEYRGSVSVRQALKIRCTASRLAGLGAA